jgi:hypothetical protein
VCVCVCVRARARVHACVWACVHVRVRAPSARHALQWTVASSCAVKCSSTADSPGVARTRRCKLGSACAALQLQQLVLPFKPLLFEPCAMADPFSIDVCRAQIDLPVSTHVTARSRSHALTRPHAHAHTHAHVCTYAGMRACTRVRLHTQTHRHTHIQ